MRGDELVVGDVDEEVCFLEIFDCVICADAADELSTQQLRISIRLKRKLLADLEEYQ